MVSGGGVMRKSKYIDMSLLDPTLKSLLEVSLKILPVPYSVITSGVNNLGVDYVVITTEGIHYNEIYRWDAGVWHLIGADDRSITWDDVTEKPVTYAPSPHSHDNLYYSKSAIDTYLAGKAAATHTHSIENIEELASILTEKADINHTHDYALPNHNHDGAYVTPMQLSQKADVVHYHAGVYSPVGHTHAELADHESRLSLIEGGYSEGHFHDNLEQLATITALKISAWDTVSDKAATSVVTAHTGDAEIHVTLSDKTAWNAKQDTLSGDVSTHHHDSRYYTEAEISAYLSLKADSDMLTTHTNNTTVHVTQTDKNKWNASDITVGTVQPTNSSIWFKTL
jgi:hypothetical protein